MSIFPIDWPMLLVCLGVSIASGLVVFHVVAGYYHIRYYVLRRDDAANWKCQPDRWLRPEQQREAALLSTFNLTLGGTISGILIYCIAKGMPTPIYLEVSEYGWPYTIASGILLFVLNDGAAYYVHRTLHRKKLFKSIHRYHHRYIATSPYVTTAVHPVELLLLQGASFLPLFFIPVHAGAIGVVLVYILVMNIVDHSGVRLHSSLPWQGPSLFHDDHHKHFHCNFGQHLMIWDRMHGTLRRVKRRYGKDVFGGRGEAENGAAEQDAFVKY
ncbi:MAG: sterol desaturase family protein [Myxococcales bacterium]|nr:sterol desaturase family protein [Myxococcales bacterium]